MPRRGEVGRLEARTRPRYPQCIPPQAPLPARPSHPPPPKLQVGASSDLAWPRPLATSLPCNLVNLLPLVPPQPCMPLHPCLQHRQVSAWFMPSHPAVPGLPPHRSHEQQLMSCACWHRALQEHLLVKPCRKRPVERQKGSCNYFQVHRFSSHLFGHELGHLSPCNDQGVGRGH